MGFSIAYEKGNWSFFFLMLFQVVRETWAASGSKRLQDCTLYTGALGTAFLVFKAFRVTKNEGDLKLCSEIIRACDAASRDSGYSPLSLMFNIFNWGGVTWPIFVLYCC